MRYTICTSYPRSDECGSGARPHVHDMIEVIRLRSGLEVSEGPHESMDGTAKICYQTSDPVQLLSLMSLMAERGIDGYWYDDNPERKRGSIVHFGSSERWDKKKSAA